MQQVGIRELKNDASEVIRAVREEGAEYIVTYHGRPVAVILPIESSLAEAGIQGILDASRPTNDFWARLDAIAARIGTTIPSDMSAAEMVAEQRRVL